MSKNETATVPSHIAESWIRSREYGVDPYNFSPHSYLPENEHQQRVKNNEQLIQIARPIMESVYNSLEQTRYLVVLYDSDGYHMLRLGQRDDSQRFPATGL